jgi:hypothetical protein
MAPSSSVTNHGRTPNRYLCGADLVSFSEWKHVFWEGAAAIRQASIRNKEMATPAIPKWISIPRNDSIGKSSLRGQSVSDNRYRQEYKWATNTEDNFSCFTDPSEVGSISMSHYQKPWSSTLFGDEESLNLKPRRVV